MSKVSIFTVLFLFGAIFGAFFYLEYTHFFEIKSCLNADNTWNYEESVCKTPQDIKACEDEKGKWIYEESTCEYGFILN